MPTIDPETGKQQGGASKERARKERAEYERSRESSSQLEIGPPPKDTAQLVTWGADCLASVIYRATQDRKIFITEADQLRFISDGCAKLGQIQDKAKQQSRIKALGERHGLIPAAVAEGTTPNTLTRPETARQVRRP